MRRIPLSAIIGMILTGAFILSALLADFIAPYGMAEVVGDVWEPISADHWFGTDTIGRDMLTRMIYGGQTTILVAAAATMISFGTGSVFGFLAATMGGWIDQAMSRFVDLLMAIPSLILALVILSVMPATLTTLILVMGFLDATRVFRLSRAVAVDITVMDYVEAARLRGEGWRWIIFREILPNALSPLVADLGGIVKENSAGLVYGKSAALIPAFAIAALAISVNLVADWVLSRTTSLKGGRGA